MLACGKSAESTPPVPERTTTPPADASTTTAPEFVPLRIGRGCAVIPPSTATKPSNAIVSIVTVLEGPRQDYEKLSDEKAPAPHAELLRLTCEWHDSNGGCNYQPGVAVVGTDEELKAPRRACGKGADPNREMRAQPNSWTCQILIAEVSRVARGFSLDVDTGMPGYVGPGFGSAKIRLDERQFTIDTVSSPGMPGELSLTCPRPLAMLKPFDTNDRSGCEVVLRNEPTHRRLVGTCAGDFEVPGVFVKSTANRSKF